MLEVECSTMTGKGALKLTGQLGNVMKESAEAAFSWVRAHSEELGLQKDFYQDIDIHIHVPEGAVPKDGPSAGVTMTTALVSALTGKPVRQDVAMTGEVTLRGRVLPIGGLNKHEFVFDGLKDKSTGVTTMDVAKRLLDYGYHAPTIYFPLLFHESLMIEPTENESKETLDGFIEVMQQIAREARENPELVKTAPHLTPIGRVDDVLAAKHPVVTYRQMQQEL
jgi:hypothetical protein